MNWLRPVLPFGVAAALLAVSVPTGGRLFTAAVVATGLLILVQFVVFITARGTRPLVPAAAVGGLGVPVWHLVDPAVGWNQLAGMMGAAVLVTFLLALVSPRSHGITAVVAATLLIALALGLGTASLVSLRSAEAGFRWTAAVLGLAILPPLISAVAARFVAAVPPAAAAVVAGGAVTGVLVAVARPPFTTPVAAVTAVLAGLALWSTQLFVRYAGSARSATSSDGAVPVPPVPTAPAGPADVLEPVALSAGLLLVALLTALLATLLQA